MSVFWVCACAYLLFAAVAMWEAEIHLRRGQEPSALAVCWALLLFGLTRPAMVVVQRLTARA
jgi:hydrogenase-4 membrane subunit HyfE